MDRTFRGEDPVKGAFRGGTGIVIGRGGTGTDETMPECRVCFAMLGGDHGGFCPNAAVSDPRDWLADPPPGYERPLREAPSRHGDPGAQA